MNSQTKQNQLGFSLIEVMVALVILSVGLLGLAGMQVSGLRSVNNSANYSLASIAVNDLAEIMRGNPAALDNGTFLVDFTGLVCNPPAVTCRTPSTTSCTPDQLATYDLYTWYCGDSTGNGVSNTLKLTNMDTIIQCIDTPTTDARPCSPGSPYEINLQWDEVNQEADGTGDTAAQSIYMRILP